MAVLVISVIAFCLTAPRNLYFILISSCPLYHGSFSLLFAWSKSLPLAIFLYCTNIQSTYSDRSFRVCPMLESFVSRCNTCLLFCSWFPRTAAVHLSLIPLLPLHFLKLFLYFHPLYTMLSRIGGNLI